MIGDVAYADANGVQVAYRCTGEATGVDLAMVAGAFFPVEALLEDRISRRFIDGLAAIGRTALFDKRGVGLSDPFVDWSRPARLQWAEDLVAVVEAAGLDHPTVVAWDMFGIARAAVSQRPDLFGRLVLVNPLDSAAPLAELMAGSGGSRGAPDHGAEPDGAAVAPTSGVPDESIERLALPTRMEEPGFREWLVRAGRSGASPTVAARSWSEIVASSDPLTPAGIACPTLVLHRSESMVRQRDVRAVAAAIPHAEVVVVPGRDVFPVAGDVDVLTAEIARFTTGTPTLPEPERVIGAVLFTDLVASTERAVAAGDSTWRDMLDRHDREVRTRVERSGGEVVKFTGDGVLAVLPSAGGAVRVARSIRAELEGFGLGVRSGIHVGDLDRRGDDVSGIAVNVAARIMGLAAEGRILVSEAARLATMGSGIRYTPFAETSLKGVPGEWILWQVAEAAGVAEPAAPAPDRQ